MVRRVNHAHPETRGSPRHGLSNRTPPDYTKGGPPHVASEHQAGRPHAPSTGAHKTIALGDPARCCEHQSECHVSSSFREYAGRVSNGDAGLGRSGEVYVIHTHREITDRNQAWSSRDRRRVETVADHAEDGITVSYMENQFVMRRWRVIVPEIHASGFGQAPQRDIRNRTGDEDAMMVGCFRSRHFQSRFK
jgi:hypothetical protein